MARKFLNKKVVTTVVSGFKLGEDGQPVPAEILLAGRYDKDKASKEVRKNHDVNFMVTGVSTRESFYRLPLDEFVRFASEYEAANPAPEVPEKTPVPAAKKATTPAK